MQDGGAGVTEIKKFGPLPESRCPQCSYKMTGATNCTGSGAPFPGDVSICLNCGQILCFQDDFTLRKVNAAEIADLMSDASQWAVIEKAQRIIYAEGHSHD
jgi:hypothetical protein